MGTRVSLSTQFPGDGNYQALSRVIWGLFLYPSEPDINLETKQHTLGHSNFLTLAALR